MLVQSTRLIAINISQWEPSQETFSQLLDLMDELSAVRIKRFRHRSDALRSLVGRLLPIYILQLALPADMLLEFKSGSHGRPYIATPLTDPPFDFNISHDGPWVIGAFSFGGKVGVDVMSLGLPDGIESTVELREALYDQLSSSEQATVSRLTCIPLDLAERRKEDERIHLLRLWMYKESLSKLIGLGSSLPFHNLSFDLSPSPSGSTLCESAAKILKIHESISGMFPPLSEITFHEVRLPILSTQQNPSGVVLTTTPPTTFPTTNDDGEDRGLELLEIEQIISGVNRFRNDL